MMPGVTTEFLADRRDLVELIAGWLIEEWPDWYGPQGPGVVLTDLEEFAQKGGLPFGMVGFKDGIPCAFGAMKTEPPMPSRLGLSPWLSAGYVLPEMRKQGIGSELMVAVESETKALGVGEIFCATGTSQSLLERQGWRHMENVFHDGQQLGVYRKLL